MTDRSQSVSHEEARGIRRLLKESVIQPDRRENQTCFQKFTKTIDIFSYIPVPQSYPVSTKRSRIGSILLILLFVAYVTYDFVQFIINNTPRINSFQTGISTTPYPVPQMAIGFIYGPSLNTTLNNASFFTIQALELNTTEGKGVPSSLQLYPCPTLPWLNDLQTFYSDLSCLNTSQAQMSGVLYASTVTLYPRFLVNLCDPNATATTGITCATQDELYNMTSGGRIFLFIQQSQSVNLAATKSKANPNQFGQFQFYNYFMVPYIYGRVIITIQPVTYVVQPDYLTSWTTKTYLQMQIVNTEYQISNVSIFNTSNLFSISVILSTQAQTVEVVYSTLIEHISLWGAFWGVVFSVFAIIFLAYNKKQFYIKRPDWEKFEDKVEQLEEQRGAYQKEMQILKKQGSAAPKEGFFTPMGDEV